MKRVLLQPRQPQGITILDTISDAELFAPWFRDKETWTAWFAFLAALFGLPMTREQCAIYRKCTGRKHPPIEPAEEAWLVIGRRGGKSFVMALIAVFLACFRDYRPYLTRGERAVAMLVAADRKQSRIVLRYIKALLTSIPMLSRMIERETMDGYELSNATAIEVHTASFRSTRGYTLLCVVADEIAFWAVDETSAEPDAEILNALRPGLATIPGSVLLCASSPYARKGELWQAHRRHFGREHDPILVWQAPTRTMNSCIPQKIIDRAMERDEATAKAEFGAIFRSDIEQFLTREIVEACVSEGVRERAWEVGRQYKAFTDPSGGASDSFTLCIGHREDKTVIVDAIREVRPRFDPDDVVREFAELLKSYGCTSVTGDRYAGEWPRSRFQAHGIRYDTAEKSKAMLYIDGALPLLNSKQIDLLDHPRLISQLCSLERRTSRGTGREIVDHPPGSGNHDDLANCVAGLAAILTVSKSSYLSDLSWVGDEDNVSYQARMMRQHILGY